jgi:hypothetical protein
MSLLGLENSVLLLGAGSRLRAAAGALFPPKGEKEKKDEFEAERHRWSDYQWRPARRAVIIRDRPMSGSRLPDVQRPRTLWPMISLIPLGFGAWAPIYAGAKAKRTLWVVLGIVWCLIVIAGFVADGTSHHPSSDDLTGGLLILGWVGAIATSFSIAPAYRRQLASPLEAAAEVGTLRLEDRAQARRLAQTNPELAAEIGIGRPDRVGATDAALIDINNAPTSALETLPGRLPPPGRSSLTGGRHRPAAASRARPCGPPRTRRTRRSRRRPTAAPARRS